MTARKMFVPDINKYSNFISFMNDFFQRNKEINKNFNYSYFAKKLKWSPSHLNDVLQGRRFLSLNKVLELIEFLEIKGVRAERLLFLALFDANGIGEKGKEFLSIKNSSLDLQTMSQDEFKLMSSPRVQQVLHFIMAQDGEWNASEFVNRSRNSKAISEAELNDVVSLLVKAHFIAPTQEKHKFRIERTGLYQDSQGCNEDFRPLQKNYVKTYLDFLDDPFAPWMDLIGVVLVPKERLPEVFERVASLRNFLYEIREQEIKKDTRTKFEVLNFSFSLFGMFRRSEDMKKQ